MTMKNKLLLRKQDGNHLDWSAVIKTPFGKLGIKTSVFEGSLMVDEIFYVAKDTRLLSPKNDLAKQVVQQMQAYFADPAFVFNLPLIPHGTDHQNQVWQKIAKIPLGEVTTYGALAKSIKSSPRAVGGACGANPYPILVPCHRVVAATGIGGFARHDEEGYHRNIKTWLLQHEGYVKV
jgi:methylated-DNA-[protein]-cysteine S-methyltransferase